MRKVLIILGELDDQDLHWILTAGHKERVASGAAIITEGQPLDRLFFIIDGRYVVSSRGRALAALESGEIVGDMSLLDSRPPIATVTSETDGTVFSIAHQVLRNKLTSDAPFAARFYRALCLFLANRLGRTTSLAASREKPAASDAMIEEDDADEISPDILDNISLAGARFDWFLTEMRNK